MSDSAAVAMDSNATPVGVVGLFDDPEALVRGARAVRDAGYSRWDCHTPYPVHGLDDAMGLKPSPVPYVTLTAGFIGLATAMLLTGGLSVWQYPIRIGGKPLWSWQAFVPIFFELFVLFAALATMAAVVVLGRLGRWHSPLHDSGVMAEVTCDRFAVVIEATDEQYSEEAARAVLEEAGCRDVRALVVHEEQDSELI
jgi:membrane protein implicated in regulation of membrane protease activity